MTSHSQCCLTYLIAVEIVNHTHIKRQEVAFSLGTLTNRELSIQNVPESNFIQ